ncbi:MAG: endopeptidase La [Bacteroidales bacterium]|nr:endopeptidase La [Bacteroidales bacterium]
MAGKNKKKEGEKHTHPVLISEIFPDHLDILPLANRPLFPGIAIPLSFSGAPFVELIRHSIDHGNGFLGVSLISEANEEDFLMSEVHPVGTLIKIIKVIQITEDSVHFFAQALQRITLVRKMKGPGHPRWEVKYQEDSRDKPSDELKAYVLAIMSSVKELIGINPMFQEQLKLSLSKMGFEHPGLLMDVISSMLSASPDRLQELLGTFDLYRRSEQLLVLLKEEIQLSQLQEKIQKQIDEKVSQQQKEYFLREQLKLIKKELGMEKDDKAAEIEKLEERIRSLRLTPEAEGVIREEMDKLRLLEPSSSEFQVTRTYLSVLTELPWGIYDHGILDIAKARQILDQDHYGLDDVKQRILEFISTIIKRRKVSGSIICLVGPPGVGKTSIGRSIAGALGRKFYRFSLGGMRDEAEIKGHRRTYVGAMPGKIIQSLKRTGTANPVIMLDEIDKLGASYQGDPASALLEVLDPEQNTGFLDHYLDVRFDLSNVLFITTANQLDTIPQPLLDRMEVIKLSGYILEEKVQIAKKYLIPKQRTEHGLLASEVHITDPALRSIVDGYAREAGVRSLENQIKKIMRHVTIRQAEGKTGKTNVTLRNIEEFLGKPIFVTEELYQNQIPGVVLGLAWTPLGGATLYIEASAIKTSLTGLKQTGQLGKVMQESSEIAYSYIRSLISHDLKLRNFFNDHFIHMHVPAGATPKDGPSAGITMALALFSLATKKPVRKGIAMTGEITLTGKVLPIGGIREKTIAARRVGIMELILPEDNRKDFDSLPAHITKGITAHFVSFFGDVIRIVFPEIKLGQD